MKMSYRPTLLLACILASLASPPTRAEDPLAEGREKARVCTTCHGLDGLRQGGDMPAIGGLEYFHLLYNMALFREGERFHPLMSPLMWTLDEADMAQVAAYFAAMDRGRLDRPGPYGVP